MPDFATSLSAAPKPWWRSRTVWFNCICACLAAAEASLGLLQGVLPVNAYAVLSFVLVVGNTLLRAITTTALVGRRPASDEGPHVQ